MNIRPQVYSPLQNTAVWISAWLYHATSTDNLQSALQDLGGRHHYGASDAPAKDLLQALRATAKLDSPEPVVRLILSGPGQAPTIPPHTPAYDALTPAGAILLLGMDETYHYLVPDYGEVQVTWNWFVDDIRPPEPEWLSPGEADELLRIAADQAATLIEASTEERVKLVNPRLTVGSLTDFYDTPGLPQDISPRAAQIFARADRVSAIIESAMAIADNHMFDQYLFAISKHIRTARMAGVAEAVQHYRRQARL